MTRETYRQLLRENPVLAAPMCGISDYPYRAICRRMGARLTYTQMASSEAIVRGDRKTLDILDLHGDESPLAMQLFGGAPEALAHAAQVLQELGAAVVDINMGCPANKVTGSRSGAALLRDLPRVHEIFRAMRRVTFVPLTVKLRWDWNDNQEEGGAALEVMRMAEGEGLDGVCLHARTREQGYSGAANWELIARLKAVAPEMPVIGNGDIRRPADALAMMRQSGCEAVMIGRAAIGDPWLLGAALRAVRDHVAAEADHAPGWPERRLLMLEHARAMVEARGEHGVVQFRKHAAAYLRGLPGAKRLRTRLMKAVSLDDLERVLTAEALSEMETESDETGPANQSRGNHDNPDHTCERVANRLD